MDSSYLVRQERCPECAKLGKDVSKDNLAVYSDSHSHCYSCGYHVNPSGIHRFKGKIEGSSRATDNHIVVLPFDSDVQYPAKALAWVGQYELSKNDLLNNNTLWSSSTSRLIFPVYGDIGLIAYQGRYFGPPAPEGQKPYPKWYGKGNLADTFHILGRSSKQLVLVEDVVSAIKLSKITMAMPLFGSFVGTTRFKRLYSLYKDTVEVLIYLDPDKRKEALVEARRGALCGLRTRVIYSERDPKEENYGDLQRIIG